jgi:hypothetical protein
MTTNSPRRCRLQWSLRSMLILIALVALCVPLASRFVGSPGHSYILEATVTGVLSRQDFVATYMGTDDGARVGQSVTVSRSQYHVCDGKIVSVTPDTAIREVRYEPVPSPLLPVEFARSREVSTSTATFAATCARSMRSWPCVLLTFRDLFRFVCSPLG